MITAELLERSSRTRSRASPVHTGTRANSLSSYAMSCEGRGQRERTRDNLSSAGNRQYTIIHIVVIPVVCCRMIPPVVLLGKYSHLGGLLQRRVLHTTHESSGQEWTAITTEEGETQKESPRTVGKNLWGAGMRPGHYVYSSLQSPSFIIAKSCARWT